MSGLQQVAYFLVDTLFDLYITIILLRMLLGYFRADFYNPISQFLVKVTNPVLVPLRKLVPAFGKIDTASVVLAFGLKLIQVFLLLLIVGKAPNLVGILILAIVGLITTTIWIFIFALIIQAVISWLGNTYGNPVMPLLGSLTNPILRPIRRYVKPIGGIDLSPLVAILALNVVLIFVKSLGL